MAPINFDRVEDPDIKAHLQSLKDATSGEEVHWGTKLIELQQDNRLMNELTGPGTLVPCSLILPGRKMYPRTKGRSINLSVTYNRLLVAPTIRCICELENFEDIHTGEKSKFVLEFHFNKYGPAERGIEDYELVDNHMSFTAFGATTAGLNNFEGMEAALDEGEIETIEALKSLIRPEPPVKIKFRLYENRIRKSDLEIINKIRERLPGGSLPLLPSLGKPQYASYGTDQYTADIVPVDESDPPHLRFAGPRLGALFNNHRELPFVAFKCQDTFSTKKEAIVELLHSAMGADMESRMALELWSEPTHRGKLYKCREFYVLAFESFDSFRLLGSNKKYGNDIKLPKELEVQFVFSFPRDFFCLPYGVRRHHERGPVGVLLNSNPGLPHHKAFFRLLPRRYYDLKPLEGMASRPSDNNVGSFSVQCEPHYNAFAFNAQLWTATALQNHSRWDAVLLNQDHTQIPRLNTIEKSKLPQETKKELSKILRTCKPWNAEQLAVIDGITETLNGMTIVMGPDGTGKGTLQRALSVYYWCLGFHILNLGPANDGCNHTVALMKKEELLQEFPGFSPFLADFQLLRYFPTSRDVKIEKMTNAQAGNKVAGHQEGNAVSLKDFIIALDERDKKSGTVYEFGILQTMIRVAEDCSLRFHESETANPVEEEDGRTNPAEEKPRRGPDAWEVLRLIIQQHKTKDLRLSDLYSQDYRYRHRFDHYAWAFRACKAHLIRLNRYMATVTTNVQATDLVDNWYDEDGADRVGVIVFVDSATRDVELNVWSGIVFGKWADDVRGAFLFGDDKQLTPVNTCSKGKVQYTPFAGRLDIALPTRLAREGFPVFRLQEQRHMKAVLSAFPAKHIYSGFLRDGPGMDQPLDTTMPGFRVVLTDIIAEGGIQDSVERQAFRLEASDAKARLHWIQVKGKKLVDVKSTAVQEHINVFFDKIWPKLHAYFESRGEKMADHVLILSAYGHAVGLYKKRMREILKSGKYTEENMPHVDDELRLLTVDGSQGKKSKMVILDGSLQGGERSDIGFMSDTRRVNVAITRAEEVLWIIGGDMRMRDGRGKKQNVPLITKYKQELDAAGHVHVFA